MRTRISHPVLEIVSLLVACSGLSSSSSQTPQANSESSSGDASDSIPKDVIRGTIESREGTEAGMWVPSGDRTPWLKEGGQGIKPLVANFQVRPDPLTP